MQLRFLKVYINEIIIDGEKHFLFFLDDNNDTHILVKQWSKRVNENFHEFPEALLNEISFLCAHLFFNRNTHHEGGN